MKRTVLAGALLAVCALAEADDQDPLYLIAATGLTMDDNVFRLPPATDAAHAGASGGRSDLIDYLQLGLTLQLAWSLQTVHVNVAQQSNRYEQHAYLDSNNLSYSASWNWQFTPHLTGTLSASQLQASAGFGDYRGYAAKNTITNQSRTFEADWWVGGGCHALGHLNTSRVVNSTVFTQENGYRQYGADLGGRYVSAANNAVTVLVRQSHGGYDAQQPDPVRQVDNSYLQDDLELSGYWAPTGRTTLSGTLTGFSRRFQHYGVRNYRGTKGNVELDWSITARSLLKLDVTGDAHDYYDFVAPYYDSGYVVENNVALSPVLTLGAKETLTLRAQWGTRRFAGGLGPSPLPREDRPVSLLAQFDWRPLRTGQVSAALRRDTRVSTVPGYDFYDNSLSLSGQWIF